MRISRTLLSIVLAATLACPASFAYSDLVLKDVADAKSTSQTNRSSKISLVKKRSDYYAYRNGKKLTSTWKTIKGSRYYFKSNGKAAKGSMKIKGKYYVFDAKGRLAKQSKARIVAVGKSKYIADRKGQPLSGWQVLDGKLYYASKSGKCAKSKIVDKIPLTSKCHAKTSDVRTKLMIQAIKIASSLTNDGMSRFEKLSACYRYVLNFKVRLNRFPPNLNKDWQVNWAYETLQAKEANCVGYSCSFSALAKALGEKPYIVYQRIPDGHTWVRINGKYWDTIDYRQDSESPHYSMEGTTIIEFW